MTLALTMGVTIGLKNTMKMMAGELLGVLIVASTAVISGSTIINSYPIAFNFFKYAGGLYLIYIGYNMIKSKGSLSINLDGTKKFHISFFRLAAQGFITSIANPKGWAFFIAMVPAFINYQKPITPQMTSLILIIVIIEFISLMIYATGGQVLGVILRKKNNIKLINAFAGMMIIAVGCWLGLS